MVVRKDDMGRRVKGGFLSEHFGLLNYFSIIPTRCYEDRDNLCLPSVFLDGGRVGASDCHIRSLIPEGSSQGNP